MVIKENNKKYVKYFLSGYLNLFYFNYDFAFDLSNGKYKQYKVKSVLRYIGLKETTKDLSWLAPIFSATEAILGTLMVLVRCAIVILKSLFIRKKSYKGKTFLASLILASFRLKGLLDTIRPKEISTLKIPYVKNDYSENEIDILTVVTLSDILGSLLLSWVTIWIQYKKYRRRDTLFRSYSSFEYYLVCHFVDRTKESNEFIFYNTYDRWAFLMSATRNSTFIQHGKLMDTLRLIKVSTPAYAYYINKTQQEVCEKVLFKYPPHNVGYRKHLEFTCNDLLKDNGKKNVLIVCWSNNIKQEWEICSILGNSVNLYIKPHPGDKDNPEYPKMAEQYDGVIVPRTGYPHVDVVVSYESTLADEYEDVDVKVIRYDLLENLNDIKKLI